MGDDGLVTVLIYIVTITLYHSRVLKLIIVWIPLGIRLAYEALPYHHHEPENQVK
jgi:hypothetical protein